MARKNGWQLSAQTHQIVAITVYSLLVITFYPLFAPFLEKQVLGYVVIGIYTTVAFSVFILYIRCTSINPADPGIMSKFDSGFIDAPGTGSPANIQGTNLPTKADIGAGTNSPTATSTCRSSLDGRSNTGGLAAGDTNMDLRSRPSQSSRGCLLGGLVCALFVKEDCRKLDDSENQVDGEDALFCTLCDAEVHKFSKHCRSCDKCVEGFDHHCRWLNNCVGRKNYFTFLALMTTSLLWLAIGIGVGIAVFVICFANKNSERIIQDRLHGLPRPAFATIVAFLTLLSLVACIPLGELFFFHMILIRKGITTFEYVVAMRAMSEVPQDEEDEEGVNIVYSPTNSATTAFSGATALSLHYKGSWCTPPRIFVDQDEVIPHLDPGMVPSTTDPDSARHAERANKAKKQVKISAWKLAKLDSNEAMRAAAKARASSSVLRPIDTRRVPGSSPSSSGNASMRSRMSADYSASGTKERGSGMKLSRQSSSYPQSLASQDDYESGTQSSRSSPVHIHKLAPHTQINVPPHVPPAPPRPASAVPRPPVPTTQISKPAFQSATSYVRENRKASVVWDQEAGRYVSVAPPPTRPVAGSSLDQDQPARGSHFLTNADSEPSNHGRTLSPMNAPSSALPPGQPSERLTYTGQSIFFGGPLRGATAAANPRRNDSATGARPGTRRVGIGGERRRTAESFPVFAPGSFQKNRPFNR